MTLAGNDSLGNAVGMTPVDVIINDTSENPPVVTNQRYVDDEEGKGNPDSGSCQLPSLSIYNDSAEFVNINDAQVGDIFYSDNALNLKWQGDGLWYSVYNTGSGVAVSDGKEFKINNLGQITAIAICVAPTPLPVYDYYLHEIPTRGNDGPGNACVDVQHQVWTHDFATINSAQTGDLIYSDSAMTTTWNGDDKWYDIGDSNGGAGVRKLKINSNGIILQTTACPTILSKAYYFHGGAGTWPYGSPNITDVNATYYYGAGTSTTDFGVAFADMMTNSPSPYNQSTGSANYPNIGEFTFGATETITNSFKQWSYLETGTSAGQAGTNEPYYLVVPNNNDFSEDLVASSLIANTANNQPVQCSSQKDFFWAGQNWTIYQLPAAYDTAAITYKFLGTNSVPPAQS
jgi:hypothetical protein